MMNDGLHLRDLLGIHCALMALSFGILRPGTVMPTCPVRPLSRSQDGKCGHWDRLYEQEKPQNAI